MPCPRTAHIIQSYKINGYLQQKKAKVKHFEIPVDLRQKHFEIRADFLGKHFEIRVMSIIFDVQ